MKDYVIASSVYRVIADEQIEAINRYDTIFEDKTLSCEARRANLEKENYLLDCLERIQSRLIELPQTYL